LVNGSIPAVQNLVGAALFALQVTRLATVTGGHVVLFLFLQLQNSRQFTPGTKTQIQGG